ncbi:MAG: YqaE/Pmp3 family membrane protein [Vicingus serpentipes]|nr:YqaE/Pmp3 family membrane protein [Vicingus serpentipes]
MVEKYQKITGKKVDDVVLIILSIFIPPLAVYLYENTITNNFWFDILFTLLFWLPGVIFAFLVCFGGVSL